MRRYGASGMDSRPSLVVSVPGTGGESIALVGAHFDVVPANRVAEPWVTDRFKLVVDRDGTLRGRGVTDCLGHVALLTEMLLDLHARLEKPSLHDTCRNDRQRRRAHDTWNRARILR